MQNAELVIIFYFSLLVLKGFLKIIFGFFFFLFFFKLYILMAVVGAIVLGRMEKVENS